MPAAFPLNTAVLYFSPRLHQALEGIFSRPLTLIEAPMGYGKTVAARDVLGKREIRLVWTSVLGNSEDAFWRDFCRALRRELPAGPRHAGIPAAPGVSARRRAPGRGPAKNTQPVFSATYERKPAVCFPTIPRAIPRGFPPQRSHYCPPW